MITKTALIVGATLVVVLVAAFILAWRRVTEMAFEVEGDGV